MTDNEDPPLRSVALQNGESVRIARVRAEQEAEATLRQQARLLNLTHDAIYVRDMERMVKYWNRGAEDLYGWTAERAIGRSIKELFETASPLPLDQVEGEVIRTGRWEGELLQTKRDGSQVVVASRWSLQLDENGSASSRWSRKGIRSLRYSTGCASSWRSKLLACWHRFCCWTAIDCATVVRPVFRRPIMMPSMAP
jgi:PAS domain S-box-containing protein